MGLKAIYDNEDDIPTESKHLYTEKDGKWVIQKIEGLATQADITRLQSALEKEKKDHKAAKEKAAGWAALGESPEAVQEQLDRIPELEAAGGGKLDDAKINELVDKRVQAKVAPVERAKAAAEKKAADLEAQVGELNGTIKRGRVETAIRKAAETAKVQPSAIEDIVMLGERVFDVDESGKLVTKDNVGVTPGIDPDAWLGDMKEKRPHWWPTSVGGGASGDGGRGGAFSGNDNPWSHGGWNLTKQGAYIREKGLERAEALAKQAGTKVGGARPAAPK